MLEVRSLSGGYGHGPVVQDIALDVARGETVGLLGPNGAGKSTLLGALSGTLRERAGQARMDGQYLIGLPSQRGDPDVPRSAINPFTSAGASEPRRHTAPSPAREPVLDLGEPRIAGTVVDRSLPSCAEAEQHPRPAAVIRSRR